MPRMPRNKGHSVDINIETHPYNERILPGLRIDLATLNFVKDNMPNKLIMDGDHGWIHILHMLVYASELCNYSDFDLDIVRWAILLHDAGHYFDDRVEAEHGKMSASIFTRMCEKAEEAGTPLLGDKRNPHICRQGVKNIVEHHNYPPYISVSTAEAIVRACDRLDLWRLPGFQGLDPELMEAAGWRKVEKIAKSMRSE